MIDDPKQKESIKPNAHKTFLIEDKESIESDIKSPSEIPEKGLSFLVKLLLGIVILAIIVGIILYFINKKSSSQKSIKMLQ